MGNEKQKTKEKQMKIVGKKMIVRANVAGVHAGVVKAFDPKTQTVVLANAYRMWRFYTRDKSGSISDIAANGLRPDAQNSIGAKLATVVITNPAGLELAEMTDAAYKTLQEWKN